MRVRRRRDRHHVDRRIVEHAVERVRRPCRRHHGHQRLGPRAVQVADRRDLVHAWVLDVADQVRAADARPDDGLHPMSRHFSPPTRVAEDCAFNASSVAVNTCSCGIAVVVRSVTSRTMDGKNGSCTSKSPGSACPSGPPGTGGHRPGDRADRCTCGSRCTPRCRAPGAVRRPRRRGLGGVPVDADVPLRFGLRSTISPKSSNFGWSGLPKLPTVDETTSADVESVRNRNWSAWCEASRPALRRPARRRTSRTAGSSVPQLVRPRAHRLDDRPDRALVDQLLSVVRRLRAGPLGEGDRPEPPSLGRRRTQLGQLVEPDRAGLVRHHVLAGAHRRHRDFRALHGNGGGDDQRDRRILKQSCPFVHPWDVWRLLRHHRGVRRVVLAPVAGTIRASSLEAGDQAHDVAVIQADRCELQWLF